MRVVAQENLKTVDYRKWLGSFIMASFGFIALWRWGQSKELFFILLAMRDFLAAYFLATRKDAIAKKTKWQMLVAYASSALPLAYISTTSAHLDFVSLAADLLTIVGFTFVTLATIELGDRLGVSPAKRGEICRSGVYKLFKHPMYVGYAIAQLGWILINPWNALIYVASMGLYVLRASSEEFLLKSK